MNLFAIYCSFILIILFVFLSQTWQLNDRKDIFFPTCTVVLTVFLYTLIGSTSSDAMKIVTSANEAKLAENIINTNDKNFSQTQMNEMIKRLEKKLLDEEDNLNGWILLARTHFDQKNYKKSIYSYNKALDLSPDQPDLMADLADAITIDNNGSFNDRTKQLLDNSIKIDPKHQKTLALLATFSMKSNDTEKAVLYWSKLKDTIEKNSDDALKIEQILKTLQMDVLADLKTSRKDSKTKIIRGEVLLTSEALKHFEQNPISLKSVIFIIAKNPNGNSMPLAVSKIELSPYQEIFFKNKKIPYKISDSNAMLKDISLSQFETIKLQAKLSYQGSVIPEKGDLFGEEILIDKNTRLVNLSLSKVYAKNKN